MESSNMNNKVSKLDLLREAVESVYVGERRTTDLLLCALLARGHVLIEDLPGVGKTTLVSALAKSTALTFARIQFTPDVLPSDITGFSIFDPKTGELTYSRGAVLNNIVLADEINRASPKTQSALLEVMQENQVTVDGRSYCAPDPFMVLATQNPIEFAGTYPLPEAQLDRFLLCLTLGYPSLEDEKNILTRFERDRSYASLSPIYDAGDIVSLQETADDIIVSDEVREYVVSITRQTRRDSDIMLAASPRASLALLRAAKAKALLSGREYVIPDDVKELAEPVLAHRLTLSSEARLNNLTPKEILRRVLRSVAVPGAK